MAKEDQPKNPTIERLRALQNDAQRDIERLEREVRTGNSGEKGQRPARINENRPNNPMHSEGQQDGSFVPRLENPKPVVIEKAQKQPVAGLEIKPQKNKSAELIRELGNVSFPIKTLCVYLLRCLKAEDTETSDVVVEKFRLTEMLNDLISTSNELIGIITSRENKPTPEDLEVNKAQITVGVMELLWEADNLDQKISKILPKKNTVEWRKIEMAKNQLRKFIGDNDSITDIPPTLRPDFFIPKPASDSTTKLVKSPEEIATEKLAEEKEKNGEIIERRKNGEDFTVEKLIGEGYSKEVATTLMRVLGLIKVQITV